MKCFSTKITPTRDKLHVPIFSNLLNFWEKSQSHFYFEVTAKYMRIFSSPKMMPSWKFSHFYLLTIEKKRYKKFYKLF